MQKQAGGPQVLHIDFLQVSMEGSFRSKYPSISSVSRSGFVNGGVIDQHLRAVMIESLPGQIPEHIDIDISNLDIGDSIHIREYSPLPGMKLLDTPTLPSSA